MTTYSSHPALDMLVQDHRRIQQLFDRFEREDDDAARQEIVGTVCREITMHAALEEELFYPAVQSEIKDPDLVDEATVEHAAARQFVEQLAVMTADDALFEATLKALGEYLNHHIRKEEETLFAEVNRARLDLDALGAAMDERRSELNAAEEAEP